MRRDGRPACRSASDDVHYARRQLRFLNDLRQQQRCERRRLRWLQYDRVSRGECRSKLPRRHQQRKVPRDDLRCDAYRRHIAIGERVFELIRPARVVEKMRGGERDVDVARLLDRLAAVHRLHDCQRSRFFLNQPRDAEDVLRAFARRDLPPHFLVRAPRRSHRAIDVLRIRLGNLRQCLFSRRIDRLEPALRMRLDELPTDEEVVALRQFDVIRRLERRRIMPFHQCAACSAGSQTIAGFESGCHGNFKFRISNEKLKIHYGNCTYFSFFNLKFEI